eukprot:COSAG03_NODE_545_length_7019_cov_13.821795_4_plen_270_part_00
MVPLWAVVAATVVDLDIVHSPRGESVRVDLPVVVGTWRGKGGSKRETHTEQHTRARTGRPAPMARFISDRRVKAKGQAERVHVVDHRLHAVREEARERYEAAVRSSVGVPAVVQNNPVVPEVLHALPGGCVFFDQRVSHLPDLRVGAVVLAARSDRAPRLPPHRRPASSAHSPPERAESRSALRGRDDEKRVCLLFGHAVVVRGDRGGQSAASEQPQGHHRHLGAVHSLYGCLPEPAVLPGSSSSLAYAHTPSRSPALRRCAPSPAAHR